jgi:sugar lactone lactonase YvrE
MTAPRVRKTLGSSVLLWFRQDLRRADVQAHWRGPHAQLVARSPSFRDYRQHHFAETNTGLWPAVEGIETAIPADRRIDGMPEVILQGLVSALRPNKQAAQIFADEANAFARTILYATGPRAGRWYDLGSRGKVRSRSVVLLRRRPGISPSAFAKFVDNQLAPSLCEQEGLRELHTQVFMPWKQKQWDTPGVAHDNPPEHEFHASIVLGFADEVSRGEYFASAQMNAVSAALAENCTAVHAYAVETTYIYVQDGRVTLPQTSPVDKPQLDPVRRVLPAVPSRALLPTSETPFPASRLIPLSGHGPEDVVADRQGRLLCGLADGRIIRLDPNTGHEETIGETGGRPLGLEPLADGRVLVCDAHRGLLRLDPATGEIETLVWGVDSVPLRFCSNVTAAADGTYWFTESTSRFDFEHYVGAMMEHRPSGRLFRRDPDGRVEVVLNALHFANGLTLSKDEQSLIFAETDGYRLTRLWLHGPRAGQQEIIADNLPGFPDNLSRSQGGRFLVALPSARNPTLDRSGKLPGWLRKRAWSAMTLPVVVEAGTTWAMAFDESGQLLADLQCNRTDFFSATGAVEVNGKLYLASVDCSNLLEIDLGSVFGHMSPQTEVKGTIQ